MNYHAVILAGGRSPWLKNLAGTEHRIAALLNGATILEHLIAALQDSGRIKRIVLSAPAEALPKTLPPPVEHTLPGDNLPSTAWAGAQALGDGDKILFVTDDIPLLTGVAVANFLDHCEEEPSAQLQYPLIYRQAAEQQFPGARRTYVHFKEGAFTGGNLTLCDRNIIPEGQKVAEKIFSLRKSPFKMAKWVGWNFIWRFATRQVSLEEANLRAGGMTGFRCRCIPTAYAELGMDLDKPADWRLIKQIMEKN